MAFHARQKGMLLGIFIMAKCRMINEKLISPFQPTNIYLSAFYCKKLKDLKNKNETNVRCRSK